MAEPLRQNVTIADEISCNKIETLLFNSAKPQSTNDEVRVQSGCPMPFVGLGEVKDCSETSEILLDDPIALKIMFEHGFVDLFEFNMFELMQLPRVPKPSGKNLKFCLNYS